MDTENALDVKRDDIRALISEKTTECSETEYGLTVYKIASYFFIDNKEHGVIIEGFINQYEVCMQATIEEKASYIKDRADKIADETNCEDRRILVLER